MTAPTTVMLIERMSEFTRSPGFRAEGLDRLGYRVGQ